VSDEFDGLHAIEKAAVKGALNPGIEPLYPEAGRMKTALSRGFTIFGAGHRDDRPVEARAVRWCK
jgi:hypothetical protein